jgi:hypothetical protein
MHRRKYKQHRDAAASNGDPGAVELPRGAAAVGEAASPDEPMPNGGAGSPDSAPPPDNDNTTALLARVREAEYAAQLAAEHHAHLQAQLAQSRQQQPDPERLERAQRFLELNPHLRDHMETLAAAHAEALSKGIEDETPDYYGHLQSIFGNIRVPAGGRVAHDTELSRREQPPPSQRADVQQGGEAYNTGGRVPVDTLDDTPSFPRGAPVSRVESPSFATGRRGHVEQKLNRQELEHAKLSGVDPDVYLEQKLKMEEYKRLGLLQDGNR